MYVGLALLVAGSLGLGLGAEFIQRQTTSATAELNEPRTYVASVLGPGAWPELVAQSEDPAPTIAATNGGDH